MIGRAPDRAPRTVGLFVEGGGLRAAYSAGVIGELAGPGGMRFDDVLGVSSGAPSAAYLAAGHVEDSLTIWRDHCHGDKLMSLWNWLRLEPYMNLEDMIRVFENQIPLRTDRLRDAATKLWVSVTNCRTGEAELVRATPENVLGLLQATMAIPIGYGRVVDVEGVPYIDGGVVDAIPIRHAMDWKHDLTVAVLTRPRGYRREVKPTIDYLIGRTYPRYPGIGRAIASRSRKSNASLDLVDELEARGELAVIRPAEPLPVSRLSTRREDIVAALESGRAAARAWLRERADLLQPAPAA